MSQTNFALAKWSARTGNALLGKRDGDIAQYRIEPMRPAEMLFRVLKDNEWHSTVRLSTSGTLRERELYLATVVTDKEWFDGFTLEITLPDTLYSDGAR